MTSPASFAPPNSFANRTAIVTGGAGSIGKPLCLALAAAGCNVVVNDLGPDFEGTGSSPNLAADVVAEIKALGGFAIADNHSVVDAAAIIDTAISAFGRIDIIFNNAGIARYGLVEDQPMENFTEIFAVNAAGPMALLHHAWPHFQKQKYGRVVNFSSDSLFGMANSIPYVVSRGAIFGATRSLALEGAPHGILVNAVHPTSYSRLLKPMFKDLTPEMQDFVATQFTGEANLPPILALAHEYCKVSGQAFSIGAYGVSRIVFGATSTVSGLRTMGDVLDRMPELLEKERQWVEPMDINEYGEFRVRTVDQK